MMEVFSISVGKALNSIFKLTVIRSSVMDAFFKLCQSCRLAKCVSVEIILRVPRLTCLLNLNVFTCAVNDYLWNLRQKK